VAEISRFSDLTLQDSDVYQFMKGNKQAAIALQKIENDEY
jgi:hypothetical protein